MTDADRTNLTAAKAGTQFALSGREKFGAPISRQQMALVRAGLTKSQKALITKQGKQLRELAKGERAFKDATEPVKALLRSVGEMYPKSWPRKSAAIVTHLPRAQRAKKAAKKAE